MNVKQSSSLVLVLGALVALAACGKKEEAPAPVVAPAPPPVVSEPAPPPAPEAVSFSSLTLGNAVGADQKISMPATTFAPNDTIYAAVATTGAASNAAIVARWTYGDGQLVDEGSQSIAPTGPATTTFHVSKPDGWPVGKYKVEITIDGNPVASQEFEVR